MKTKIPALKRGYGRQWLKCNTCGVPCFHDYIPYSLANPILILKCGHGSARVQDGNCTEITELQALEIIHSLPEKSAEILAFRGHTWLSVEGDAYTPRRFWTYRLLTEQDYHCSSPAKKSEFRRLVSDDFAILEQMFPLERAEAV